MSPLKFDIFTQGYDEYVIEFKNNEPLVTKLILKYELDYYNFIKDIADYKFNGKDYKNQLPQEYYDEKEIEVSILEGLNAKKIFDNCFEIIDFLKQKNIEFENNYIIKSKNIDVNHEISNEIKPIFKHEIIDTVFSFLKDHFDINQHHELETILKTGNDVTKKLYFKGNANKIADAFKQLINVNFITGCQKQNLENWIFRNFQYKNNKNTPTDFKLRYLEDIISTNKDSCRKPIFEIKKVSGIYTITEV